MFRFLWGFLVPASSAGRPRLSRRLDQALVLVLLLAPFGATVYAVVSLWSRWPSSTDLALLAGFYAATSVGVTVGFHRMLTHSSFTTNPVVKAVLLIFGTWSIQGASLSWATNHAKHHVYSDTDEDPHSPTRGFWHAHMGWLLTTTSADPERYVKAQMKDPVVMFVSRTAFWWAVLGMVLPYLIGGWTGFLWGSLVRVFLVHHVTWSVNSVCHTFGTRPYKTKQDLSTNNFIVGLLAVGEGWHNNHHAFPRSAFHGLSWKQIDIAGYIIHAMGWAGLAKNIYRVPRHVIEARKSSPVLPRGLYRKPAPLGAGPD